MKRFNLDPRKNLTEQPLFWLVNGIISLFAIILVGVILNKGSYSIDWSPDGFRFFLFEFGFPISILAMIIPATALIATIHRSSQLSSQINQLMHQNNFANYYKHYEMFRTYFLELCSENPILNEKKSDNIYRRLFPNSRQGNYYIDESFLNGMDIISKEYLEMLKKIEDGKITYFEFIFFSSNIISKISEIWGGYWMTPMEFGNTILKTIPGIDDKKVKFATYGNIKAKFIKADYEDKIFEKTLNYFKLISKLLEFEISLDNKPITNNLNLLINKELVMVSDTDEKRIANRTIHFVTRTKQERL